MLAVDGCTLKSRKVITVTLKARLVARGFEEKDVKNRTDSPTCSKQALRMIFVTASTMTWELNSLDISAAFLQGNKIEREIFMQPPPEFCRRR